MKRLRLGMKIVVESGSLNPGRDVKVLSTSKIWSRAKLQFHACFGAHARDVLVPIQNLSHPLGALAVDILKEVLLVQ